MNSKRDDSQTKSYFGGKFVTGPDNVYFYLTLVLMYVPHGPFFGLICPYFLDKISAAVYVIPGYILVFATITLFLAAFTDPGILPRGKPMPEDPNPFSDNKPPSVRKFFVKGVELETKYCDTCDIYRPIRTSHCGICNNCVENFDHHCPWVGNCIGKRNYRYYLWFILAASTECLYVMSLSLSHIILNANASDKHSRGDRAKDGLAASYYFGLLLPIYAVCGLGFVGGLCGFHCYLVSKGVSTNEFIKKSFKNRFNPFSQGPIMNYIRAYCPPGFPMFFRASRARFEQIELVPTSSTSISSASSV